MLSMSKYNTGNSSYGNEYGVSSKKFQQTVVVELGLKLHQQQQDHHHNHNLNHDDHDNHDNHDENGDIRCGATCNGYKMMSSPIYSVATPVTGDSASSVHSSSSTTTTTTRTVNPGSVSASGGFLRGLQPFDVSSSYFYSPPNPFYKSSGGMATTAMGYPFTATQWKELERQAMIYKYMMASLPVPPDLLYSSFPTNSSFAPASYFMGKYGSGIAMRWSGNSKDAEPGRCRRTDGKKWRCSRDVAPNQKYCERHMHRGRPRSRKHVEQQQQTPRNPISNLSFTNSSNNNDNITPTKKTRLSSDTTTTTHSVQQPYSKASFFAHPLAASVNPFDVSRSLSWTEEQQWNQLVQTNNMNSSVFQQHFEGEPLNLISHGGYNTKCDEMGLLERPLIDAWSMGVTSGNKDNVGNGNKLSMSSSNGGNNANNTIDEEMCQIHMGLGLIDSWVGSNATPGGPLAEVLRPGNPAMSEGGESELVTPPATAVSSPSGVLQKTLATFSDSSGSNSPTTTCHNSKPHSDMPFRWLN